MSLLASAHACSQACSQGQSCKHQKVMGFCEVCEAIFLMFLEIKKMIGRGVLSASRCVGVRIGILASHCSHVGAGPSGGGGRCGSGDAR